MSVALGVVAGEISGDTLGGDLLDRMLKLDSSLEFCGLGGERMQRPQLEELGDMYLLATNGIVEPLRRLPKLLALRRTLADTFIERQVQGFIGIDAPDFNLGLAERRARQGHQVCSLRQPADMGVAPEPNSSNRSLCRPDALPFPL